VPYSCRQPDITVSCRVNIQHVVLSAVLMLSKCCGVLGSGLSRVRWLFLLSGLQLSNLCVQHALLSHMGMHCWTANISDALPCLVYSKPLAPYKHVDSGCRRCKPSFYHMLAVRYLLLHTLSHGTSDSTAPPRTSVAAACRNYATSACSASCIC
jgi:hypothetical protein